MIDVGGKRYATVVIDPPWQLSASKNRAISGVKTLQWIPYETFTLDEIKRLTINGIMAENAFCFCWTVNKYLGQTISEVLPAWGLRYSFTMSWVKSKGPQIPRSPCFNSEWVVVGKKGSPEFTDWRDFRTGNTWKRGAHSAKPEGFYDLLRRVTPEPRIDIFNRRRIAGFDSWGDQAPEQEAPLPGYYQDVMF